MSQQISIVEYDFWMLRYVPIQSDQHEPPGNRLAFKPGRTLKFNGAAVNVGPESYNTLVS